MKREEYVNTIVYNGHMINIGLDESGQQYFLEYEKDGNIYQTECGIGNEDYQYEIEHLFGKPEQCVSFGIIPTCEQIFTHGYCHCCPYSILVQKKQNQNKP